MNSLKPSLYNVFFSHIYIEREIRNHSVVKRILDCFPDAAVVEINHYKDVFCRSRQNYGIQKNSPSLILARKQQNLVYEGAPVCQNFGNRHFYYTSSVMNCIYDCKYCYLQGMYPSANMVVFVNLEDIFEQVEILLERQPVYLCVSYDTDLLALEHILGYTKRWFDFALKHKDLTIEVRTKSANINVLDKLQPLENVILAWTLSPERLSEAYEHHVPSFWQRLSCIEKAISKGFKVRLC
ncbi:MAG TPA: radical SAM protein, partial [Ruminiclostridium sp.]|nr:radical SAM protein [Ruminiclostridium sp.]